ncbi:hypothetical protein E6C27_scaffold133G001460 [Cucumis melo var. makuwa]|uniref:Uncharacterized protein n=1 Tax=Cucumis melo var. makuwa TaxID=1194695 RepID=A0A5A7U0W1_CUCMM|nr:hypothetical protein E6C27_scaffold133G001460 [Cucumis melo var. makuwa]
MSRKQAFMEALKNIPSNHIQPSQSSEEIEEIHPDDPVLKKQNKTLKNVVINGVEIQLPENKLCEFLNIISNDTTKEQEG